VASVNLIVALGGGWEGLPPVETARADAATSPAVAPASVPASEPELQTAAPQAPAQQAPATPSR